MLKLKHSFHFPHFDFENSRPLQLAPISNDDDDLSQAIYQDPIEHDNNWVLTERPDTNELESYWNQVESDLRDDPEWVNQG